MDFSDVSGRVEPVLFRCYCVQHVRNSARPTTYMHRNVCLKTFNIVATSN